MAIRPCEATPEWMWISDFPATKPGGNQQVKGKFPWTDCLVARAYAMREAGDSWREIALALAEETGVRLTDHATQDYIQRFYEGGR